MRKPFGGFLEWLGGRRTKSLGRVERVTLEATNLVALRLWNYRIPASEREHLARMRNLLETLAALRFRRRLGERSAETLLQLSRTDDEVDRVLALIQSHSLDGSQFVHRFRRLRQSHRKSIDVPGHDPEHSWQSCNELNQLYFVRLSRALGKAIQLAG
jgi:hypothetical protein